MVSDQNLSLEMFLIRLLYITESKSIPISKDEIVEANIPKNSEIKSSPLKTIDQLKSSTQELESEELNEEKIEIKSFNKLIDVCNQKKETL